MTPIYREQIDRRIAWQGSDFRSKDDFAFDLSAKHVAALKDILSRVKGLPLEQITLAQCRHAALDADLARLFNEIQHGRGIVLVRGMPVTGHSPEEIERMYWIFGTHFGQGLSQNFLGHLLGRI